MTTPLIPVTEVTEADFWAALKPLYVLIGSTPMHQFSDGMVFSINRDEDDMQMHVRFKAVVEAGHEVSKRWPVVSVGDHEHPEFDELAYDVDVVVKGSSTDVIADLWPGAFPAGETTNNKAGA